MGAPEGTSLRSLRLTVLTTVVAFGALYVGRALFVPAAFGFVLALALAPIVRGVARLRIPLPLGAVLVLGALVVGLLYAVATLAEPARSWARDAPGKLSRIEWKLRAFKKPLEEVTEATKSIEDVALVGPVDTTATVTVKDPDLATLLATQLRGVTIGGATALVLAYFLLATDNRLLRSLIEALPGVRGDDGAQRLSRTLESQLSRYLLTVTIVNALLGVTVGVVTYLMGLPNPTLWGGMAMILNYVPYVGGIVSTTVLTGVALLTFSDLWDALSVPLVFVAINGLEGMVVTPVVLGRQLLLSPVAIVLGLMLWSWLWGIPGALLAVPLLLTVAVIGQHVVGLGPLVRVLRGE